MSKYLVLLLAAALAHAATDYKVQRKFPIPGTESWDYITVDSAARRLYVSHSTRVEVLDADTGVPLGFIPDTPGIHGIAIAGAFHHGFTSNGKENTVSMFDPSSLKLIKKISVGEGPDGIYFDPGSKRIFTCNHGSDDITVIDAASGEVAGTVKVDGGGEQMITGRDGLLYVNIEDTNEVVAFDPKTLTIRQRFSIGTAKTPTGLAYDAKNNRLFIVCRSKSLVVMDAAHGRILATLPIGAGVDAAYFDTVDRLVFASNGDGTISVIQQKSADEYEDLGAITTQPSAKTMAFDPQTRNIFLPAAEFDMIPASDASKKPRRKIKEGTFGVLVVRKAGSSTVLAQPFTAATLPTDQLLSKPGPSFAFEDNQLPSPVTVIAYGDQRFTDPANVKATNPRVRERLVNQIAAERPAAIVLNGDVPLSGDVTNDYAVFQAESKPWRDAQLHVFPALGNHEFHGDPQKALEHWWNAFPEMRNRRWYSAQLGSRVYVLALDSDTSLLPGSDQARWIENQIDGLPSTIDFVIVTMHHPPVADVQKRLEIDHNPRPNEIALRDYLLKAALTSHARFLISAGHIHNYERNLYEGVVYLVSGGGGAKPVYVERTPEDLYQSVLFPNYHYVKLTIANGKLHGEMYRISNPEAKDLTFELKDSFDIAAKPR